LRPFALFNEFFTYKKIIHRENTQEQPNQPTKRNPNKPAMT